MLFFMIEPCQKQFAKVHRLLFVILQLIFQVLKIIKHPILDTNTKKWQVKKHREKQKEEKVAKYDKERP